MTPSEPESRRSGGAEPLPRNSRVYVAGHRGLVGSAIWRTLEAEGFTDLVGRSSGELDLRDRSATFDFIKRTRPAGIVMAAARVGGIGANQSHPVEFLTDNLLIQTNLLDAAHAFEVPKVLFLGSSCIYPRDAAQPIVESALMTGELEPTNFGYAMAKLSGVALAQAYRQQYGHAWICAMPTNLYGPHDNFDLVSAHVLPALIRRFVEAQETGLATVTLWGSGTPRREFLHVDDLARACLFLLEGSDEDAVVNVGTGHDLRVSELAALVAEIVGYEGEIRWDTSRPDGVPRKVLDVTRMTRRGWSPTIDLADGIRSTVDWYRREGRP